MRTSPEEVAEFRRQLRNQAGKPPRTDGPINDRLLQQAIVATEVLTGDAAWDVFLQRVQALIDGTRKDLAAMAEHHALPNLTSEQILQQQRHMLAAKERINAWEMVLSLPKQIMAERDQSKAEAASAA